jgi:hypothetical protein
MINAYLNYIQEEIEELNEFVVLPLIVLINYSYKKYIAHKKLAKYCVGTIGVSRKKCFLIHKIKSLEKVKNEIDSLKSKCNQISKNEPKCIKKINREIEKINRQINILKTKLSKL